MIIESFLAPLKVAIKMLEIEDDEHYIGNVCYYSFTFNRHKFNMSYSTIDTFVSITVREIGFTNILDKHLFDFPQSQKEAEMWLKNIIMQIGGS